jgi:hypothetical protein
MRAVPGRSELRALTRAWYLWLLLPLVAFLAWRLLPVNARLFETFVDSDPQPSPDVLAAYRTDALAVYTSGFGCGQLLSTVAGAVLALRDPRPLGSKVTVAAGFALVLALVDVCTVLVGAGRAIGGHWAIGELARRGIAVDRLTLADWPVRLALAGGVVSFALWAVVGVGLGALAGGWRRLVVPALGYPVLLLVMYEVGRHLGGPARPVAAFVTITLAVPVVVWALLVYLSVSGWAPVAAGVTLSLAAATLAAAYRATSRRSRSSGRTNGTRAGHNS